MLLFSYPSTAVKFCNLDVYIIKFIYLIVLKQINYASTSKLVIYVINTWKARGYPLRYSLNENSLSLSLSLSLSIYLWCSLFHWGSLSPENFSLSSEALYSTEALSLSLSLLSLWCSLLCSCPLRLSESVTSQNECKHNGCGWDGGSIHGERVTDTHFLYPPTHTGISTCLSMIFLFLQ